LVVVVGESEEATRSEEEEEEEEEAPLERDRPPDSFRPILSPDPTPTISRTPYYSDRQDKHTA
jgi:hypothetical protein